MQISRIFHPIVLHFSREKNLEISCLSLCRLIFFLDDYDEPLKVAILLLVIIKVIIRRLKLLEPPHYY